jgi:hypothetical protein
MREVSKLVGGKPVSVACTAGQEPLAEDLLQTLARISERDGLRPGSKVRFGWSVLTVRERTGGGLEVCEPDFDGDPLTQIRPQVSTTLGVLAQQTVLARRVGVTPVDVGFEQKLVVARGALDSTRLHLFRSDPASGDDSGWTVTSDDAPGGVDDPDSFETRRLFDFLHLRPVVLSALCLPPEFAVVIDGDRIETVFDAEGRPRL